MASTLCYLARCEEFMRSSFHLPDEHKSSGRSYFPLYISTPTFTTHHHGHWCPGKQGAWFETMGHGQLSKNLLTLLFLQMNGHGGHRRVLVRDSPILKAIRPWASASVSWFCHLITMYSVMRVCKVALVMSDSSCPPGSSVHGILRQEYWSGLTCLLP